MILCVVTGTIGPRYICDEDVPDTVLSCCHEHATSFKNIFRTGSETLEKSVCSRYTGLVGRFVHGGSLLCAFLYEAVSELALGHSSFLCHRHMAGNTMEGRIFQHGVLYDFLVKSQVHKHNILCRMLFHMHKILWFRQKCASGGICQLLIASVCPKTWSSLKLYLTRCWTLSI